MIIASAHADPSVRLVAVKKLLQALGTPSMQDTASIQAALLLRIYDADPAIPEEIYKHPALVLPVLHKEEDFTLKLANHLMSGTASRQLVRVHLSFVAAHTRSSTSPAAPFDAHEVVAHIFFPFLLFSKPRQKSAAAAWAILGAHSTGDGIGGCPLLRGCADVCTAHGGGKDADMARANAAIADKIAENIVMSNEYDADLGVALERLGGSEVDSPHARLFAYLIVRELLKKLSGARQIDLARKVLDVIDLEAGGELGVQQQQNWLNEETLMSAVVMKPTSRNTLHRIQASVLAFLPQIWRSEQASASWLAQPPDVCKLSLTGMGSF
jgi:U3 small nucleolar RNA-associated protein 10